MGRRLAIARAPTKVNVRSKARRHKLNALMPIHSQPEWSEALARPAPGGGAVGGGEGRAVERGAAAEPPRCRPQAEARFYAARPPGAGADDSSDERGAFWGMKEPVDVRHG